MIFDKNWLVDWKNYAGRIDNQDMLMFMVKCVSPVPSVVVTELLLSPQWSSLEYSPPLSLYKSTMTCSSPGPSSLLYTTF